MTINVPISKNWFGDEEFAAIQQPLSDGWVVQGRQVQAFENSFAQFTGSPSALACSSGTAALHIAVAALGLKPGDEVIVPGFTWVATANVVELMGAKPVFCDIELSTFNIDPAHVEELVTDRTVGIIPVHLFGLCADMDPIREIAKRHGLWIVEDAACALGSWYRDQHAGTIGDIGCFSFHPRKSITTGEGGMLTVVNSEHARLCEAFRNHGAMMPKQEPGQNHSRVGASYSIAGLNYRLSDIQAALGNAQMTRLEFLLAERQRCADYYARHLNEIEWLHLPQTPNYMTHGWQSYVTVVASEPATLDNVDRLHDERNQLMAHLQECGIATRQGTHAPPHLEYYADKYNIKPHNYPASWLADRLTMALPLYPGITEEQLAHVVSQIVSYKQVLA